MTSASGTANMLHFSFFLSFFLSFSVLFCCFVVVCLLLMSLLLFSCLFVVFKPVAHFKTISSLSSFWNLFYLAGFRAKLVLGMPVPLRGHLGPEREFTLCNILGEFSRTN